MPRPKPVAPDGQKVCGDCALTKPLEDYHKRAASPDGRQGRCKVCNIIECRWRRAHGHKRPLKAAA